MPAEIARRQERLEVIRAARERLEQRQREADTARGRSEGDERKPRDGDGKPKGGGTYAREFGVPAPKAQDNFTDPQSRIMKRAGGGFDYAYNAQAAVDDTAHIIVGAELSNNGSEPPNGWVKNVLGFRQFSMRGLTRAQAEWKLVCAALNLRPMATMMAT